MSYENPTPPVPTRAEEIFMIQKAKKSLERNTYRALILNEANRTQQLDYMEMQDKYRIIWWRNFIRGTIVMSVPALLLAVSFRKGQYGVPRYRISKFYDAFQLPHQQAPRLILVLKYCTPLWVLGSYSYAYYMTSDDGLMDEYYDKYNKSRGLSSSSLKEISYLSTLNHPNIIQLLDLIYLYQEEQLFLIFEYMNYDLQKFIKKKGIQNITKIKFIAKEILKGLNYCHKRGILHRDVKLKNVLLDKKCKIVKLADFGLSTNFNIIPKKFNTRAGTLYYQAPEILLNQKEYSYQIDIWAFGCLIAELFYGKPIFTGLNDREVLSNILKIIGFEGKGNSFDMLLESQIKNKNKKIQGKGLEFIRIKNNQFSKDIEGLLLHILKLNPQERPTCDQILSHPFFNQQFQNLQQLIFNNMELDSRIQEHLEFPQDNDDKVIRIVFVGGGCKSPGFTALATKACVIIVIQLGGN